LDEYAYWQYKLNITGEFANMKPSCHEIAGIWHKECALAWNLSQKYKYLSTVFEKPQAYGGVKLCLLKVSELPPIMISDLD
jgi:hypothetical protein